VIADN
jgi:hypothetical protein